MSHTAVWQARDAKLLVGQGAALFLWQLQSTAPKTCNEEAKEGRFYLRVPQRRDIRLLGGVNQPPLKMSQNRELIRRNQHCC